MRLRSLDDFFYGDKGDDDGDGVWGNIISDRKLAEKTANDDWWSENPGVRKWWKIRIDYYNWIILYADSSRFDLNEQRQSHPSEKPPYPCECADQ